MWWAKWELNERKEKECHNVAGVKRRKEVGLYGCLSILKETWAGLLTKNKTWFPFVDLHIHEGGTYIKGTATQYMGMDTVLEKDHASRDGRETRGYGKTTWAVPIEKKLKSNADNDGTLFYFLYHVVYSFDHV